MVSKEKKTSPQQDGSAQSEFIRRFKSNPLIFIGTLIVLIIVIVAFVFVPAFGPRGGGAGMDLSFGSYNKIPISYVPGNYFSQVRETLARRYQSSGGETNFIQNYQIWRRAFEEAVIHTAILDEMKRIGYTPPEELVNRRIVQSPQFQENGSFSSGLYRSLDKQTRMSLWRQMQESITEEYYRDDITELRSPSQEAPFIVAMGSPQRTFDMVSFSLQGYPDTAIKAYALEHGDLFLVTHLSQITITTSEREAQQLRAAVQEGTATFEDTARNHSKDSYTERGGDIGIRMAYEFIKEVPDAADRESLMKLPKGELSPIIKVSEGWVFYRAEEEPSRTDTNDAALLGKVRSYIMEFEKGQVEDYFLQQADAFIEEVTLYGFDEALSRNELEKRTFGPLPINYGDIPLFNSLASSSVPEIANAGTNESFWRTAFSTPLLSPSKSLVIGNNVVVLYPKEETQVDERNAGYMETNYSSYWLRDVLSAGIRSYFLGNKKLDDRFWDAYTKYIQPAN